MNEFKRNIVLNCSKMTKHDNEKKINRTLVNQYEDIFGGHCQNN